MSHIAVNSRRSNGVKAQEHLHYEFDDWERHSFPDRCGRNMDRCASVHHNLTPTGSFQ